MEDRADYISMEEAANQLGVKRVTLYYYIRTLELEPKKFPLDKRKYLKVSDVEYIKSLKHAATEGKQKKDEDAA
jgi:predicted DNA-binding transcriptional regulator AlpA